MASPTTAITRFDMSLSYAEFSQMAQQRKMIGLKALPPVGVALQSSDFLKLTIGSVANKPEDDKRAEGGSYTRKDFEFTKDSYSTDDHGVEETLDDRRIKRWASVIRAERVHARRAISRALNAFEANAAAAVFNTTTWSGALTNTVAGVWTSQANALPIADIDAAIEVVANRIGMRPNTLILTWSDWRFLTRTDEISALLKYSGQDDPKSLGSIAQLKELWDLDSILIGDGYKVTSDDGAATTTLGNYWTAGTAMVAHINPMSAADIEDPMPSIGYTVMWNEENASIPGDDSPTPPIIFEEYREEARRGSALRARLDYQHKIVHAEAGQLLTGIQT